ncbi:unannotated protein [freshwater metagenome]|uniref:Unannotated protein n=1 Tax=freshwater metagenome TaxID=449393 RepID=A0A6J7IJM8_9ZZZZ|nr:DUF3566 domain-containing protein [Actinomycetota bacterium]
MSTVEEPELDERMSSTSISTEPRSRQRAATVAPRHARLFVTRLDPWSVAKVSFMLSLALAVMILIAVAAMWWVLTYTGVFDSLARNLDEIIGSGSTTFDLVALLSFPRVMGVALLVSALEIVLMSIMGGLLAMLYNITVGITGGAEVVLSDDV